MYSSEPVPTRVNAVRAIRRMRGGSQSCLIEADDGCFYVVKFAQNPQGVRVLVNEWFGAALLRHIGITCPPSALVRVTSGFLCGHRNVGIRLGSQTVQPAVGWHFGSRYPGNPDRTAVFDFVPDTLLERLVNLHEFAGVLAFDKWACNADFRQSIFIRDRIAAHTSLDAFHPRSKGFIALMIDHGFLFNGPCWELKTGLDSGFYFRDVYRDVHQLSDFQPWLSRIMAVPDALVYETLLGIPPEWQDGFAPTRKALAEKLLRRREMLPTILDDCLRQMEKRLPQWGTAKAAPPEVRETIGAAQLSGHSGGDGAPR